jgi:hypothetical protein
MEMAFDLSPQKGMTSLDRFDDARNLLTMIATDDL